MRGAWALVAVGLALLLLGVVASLAGTRATLEMYTGSGIVYEGQVYSLDSIVGVPRGFSIVNGTITMANVGNATAIILVGPLESPLVLELRPNDTVEAAAGPGYSISLHSRGEGYSVVSVNFTGWTQSSPGAGIVLLSLVLFAAGSIASTLGVVIYFLYHMEKR